MSTAIPTATIHNTCQSASFNSSHIYSSGLTGNQIREIQLRQGHLLFSCEVWGALLLNRTDHRLHGYRDAPNQQIQRDKWIIAQQCRYCPQDKRDLVDDFPDEDGVEPSWRIDEERVFVLCNIPLAEVDGELRFDRGGERMGKIDH
jgi:hypothetical protein